MFWNSIPSNLEYGLGGQKGIENQQKIPSKWYVQTICVAYCVQLEHTFGVYFIEQDLGYILNKMWGNFEQDLGYIITKIEVYYNKN